MYYVNFRDVLREAFNENKMWKFSNFSTADASLASSHWLQPDLDLILKVSKFKPIKIKRGGERPKLMLSSKCPQQIKFSQHTLGLSLTLKISKNSKFKIVFNIVH